jgi:hypothetical protein
LHHTVAGQDQLQKDAQALATQGVGSFQPFLQQAQTQAGLAAGLGTQALGQLGTAGSTLGGIGPLGAHSFSTRRISIYVPLSITSD